MGIVEELVEIWPNEVCDKIHLLLITNSWDNYFKTINQKAYKALQGSEHNIWYRGKKGEKVKERRIWI